MRLVDHYYYRRYLFGLGDWILSRRRSMMIVAVRPDPSIEGIRIVVLALFVLFVVSIIVSRR
jgi:hypothetical protein